MLELVEKINKTLTTKVFRIEFRSYNKEGVVSSPRIMIGYEDGVRSFNEVLGKILSDNKLYHYSRKGDFIYVSENDVPKGQEYYVLSEEIPDYLISDLTWTKKSEQLLVT